MADYNLDGMSCGHCVKSVENLMKEKGLSGSVSLEEKKLFLERELDQVDFDSFAKELLEDGFTLTKI